MSVYQNSLDILCAPPVICSVGPQSGAGGHRGTPSTSTNYPAANRAYGVWFRISRIYRIVQHYVIVSATTSGNADIGCYLLSGPKIATSGQIVMSGGTSIIGKNVTPYKLYPGLYYMVISHSTGGGSATEIVAVIPPQVAHCKMTGMFSMESAYPLPDTIVPATCASAYVPIFGLSEIP